MVKLKDLENKNVFAISCSILEKKSKDLRKESPRDVKLRQDVVNIWIFVFLAKQYISTDWEQKNSQQLQKHTKIQMLLTPCWRLTSLGLTFF